MMFFSTGLRKIHPGNIYSVEQLQNRFKETIDKENIDKKKIDSILVDLTPGCSFAHSNFLILLEGIIVKNVSPNEQKTINNLFASESFLKDIYIDNNNQLNYLIIDYMSILTIKKEELDYDPIMCLKENYRMNIQQQFGHYLARIGDNIYHSKKKEKNF